MTLPRILAARRAAEIEPFQVMDVLARAQALEAAGRRVIHMEIGEPDFTAPQAVVEAGVRALRGGLTSYTATLGLGALREAIAAWSADQTDQALDASRVAVTPGASGGLLLALALYVNPGDEVLVPDPGYPGYRHFVRAFEGVARPLALSPHTAFQPSLDMVRAAWGPDTKALVLGSPSNPTGTIVAHAELKRIARFVAERGGVLIADEIYQGLVYGAPSRSALGLPGEVVLVNSFSKYFCMTGWRLGWVVLPAARVRDFEKLAQHFYICAPSAAQHAALAAFEPGTLQVLEQRRQEFQRRRDFLVPALEHAGLTLPAPPCGAFYAYADCSAFDDDAKHFALEMLEQAGVAATPGLDFGIHGTRRCLRFAYTRGMAELEEAAARIAAYCATRR
jgi:aspartate/methionine/tyrosine aminotransferase